MIYLKLFLTFLKIGAVAFGGGYAMLPLMQESVLNNSWLSEEELLNFVAVSESTPGPVSINLATFIGYSQGGILGAMIATLGVVLPAFIIILIVSIFVKNLLNYAPVRAVLNGIKPVIVALILATAVNLFLSVILSIKTIDSTPSVDGWGLLILAIITLIYCVYYKVRKKAMSPILLIVISGICGAIFYSL